MLCRTVVLLCCLLCVSAFTALAPLETKPEKYKDQAGCYMSELDRVVPFGEKAVSITQCVQYSCGEKYVFIAGCGAVQTNSPNEVIEEKDKPYPDCCPKVKVN